jgi:hypothetical protein
VIVDDLYAVGIPIHEPKADTPLVVDGDGELTSVASDIKSL